MFSLSAHTLPRYVTMQKLIFILHRTRVVIVSFIIIIIFSLRALCKDNRETSIRERDTRPLALLRVRHVQ